MSTENSSEEHKDKALSQVAVISRLKISLDTWIDSCEKVGRSLNDLGHIKEAQSFQGQATAYWAVKSFLEENGL